MEKDDNLTWSARCDAYRPTTYFTDLMTIVASYYDMYNKAYNFLGPWIARQSKTASFPPDKEEIKSSIGKVRSVISFTAHSKFVDALFNFVLHSKGKRALINPTPTTHHSAQFPAGTFSITEVSTDTRLIDDKAARRPAKTLHALELFGADQPLFIENLPIKPEQIRFIIVRPKLGKLGTPSVKRWEVLLYRQSHSYLLDHVDCNLNPRWAGKM